VTDSGIMFPSPPAADPSSSADADRWQPQARCRPRIVCTARQLGVAGRGARRLHGTEGFGGVPLGGCAHLA